jgi:excisionase family DNA binding protein
LKPQELADLLGVPISFVYDRTRQNSPDSIPHFKVGKYVRFDLATVKEWLAERTR